MLLGNVRLGLAGRSMIGYLVPNASVRESAVVNNRIPMIDEGHVRPNLSGFDRQSLPMGGTQAVAGAGPWPTRRRGHALAARSFPSRLIGVTHAYLLSSLDLGRPPAPARAGWRLHRRLLRLRRRAACDRPGADLGSRACVVTRPRRLGEPGGLAHRRLRPTPPGGRRGDRHVAGSAGSLPRRTPAGLPAQRRQPAGGPALGHARRGEIDAVLPIRCGECGTCRCASHHHPLTPHTA